MRGREGVWGSGVGRGLVWGTGIGFGERAGGEGWVGWGNGIGYGG